MFTGNYFFASSSDDLDVANGADDSLQGANLRTDAQRQQHQEENDGPERCSRQFDNCLSENDKHQACPFNRLSKTIGLFVNFFPFFAKMIYTI